MSFRRALNEWYKKFKLNMGKENKKEILYAINKEFFFSPNNRGNLNIEILNKDNKKELEEESDFDIINEDIWQMIKKKYPNEKEIPID